MDLAHSALKTIDHNRYTAISIAGALMLAWVAFSPTGCAGTLTSAVTGEAVSPEQFSAELESARVQADADARADERATARTVAQITAQAERDIANALGDSDERAEERATAVATLELTARASWETFEREQETRRMAFDALSAVAGTAMPTLLPLLGTAGMILGAGSFADSRRKDKVIKINGARHTAPPHPVTRA